MAVYGLVCDPRNSIWTSASLRSIYYFVGDIPVHKLPFIPKCQELFVKYIWKGDRHKNSNSSGLAFISIQIDISILYMTDCMSITVRGER